jgi:hypothetical protein
MAEHLTSQQELAIWQPAWPTVLQKLASSVKLVALGAHDAVKRRVCLVGRGGPKGASPRVELARTVDADNLTHGECCFCDVVTVETK